jgi:hypothetical protein
MNKLTGFLAAALVASGCQIDQKIEKEIQAAIDITAEPVCEGSAQILTHEIGVQILHTLSGFPDDGTASCAEIEREVVSTALIYVDNAEDVDIEGQALTLDNYYTISYDRMRIGDPVTHSTVTISINPNGTRTGLSILIDKPCNIRLNVAE